MTAFKIEPPLVMVTPKHDEVIALAAQLISPIRKKRTETREQFVNRVVAAYKDAECRLSFQPLE